MSLDIKSLIVGEHLFDKSLKELKTHGSPDFPVQFYESAFIDYNEFYTHWHPEIEVIYINSGKMKIKINHQSFDVDKESFVIISKGALHSIHDHPLSDEITKFTTLIFDLNMLSSINREYTQKTLVEKVDNYEFFLNGIIKKDSEVYDNVFKLFFEIYDSYKQRKPNYQIEIKGLLHLFIYHILNQKDQIVVEIKKRPKINISHVIDIITTNLDKKFTIQELAQAARYNEAYLMREFKKATNYTIIEFINKQKIEKSKVMLTSTEDNVSIIANKAGYNNVNYFIRKFKEQEGITPFEYRKTQRT